MPELLFPGVFVEETSFRSKVIEGVPTSTAGFVGPTRKGVLDPVLLTGYPDFERICGGSGNHLFECGPATNYLAHAVRAYFDNGGKRLYVARAVNPDATAAAAPIVSGASFVARFPGAALNGSIVTVRPAELEDYLPGITVEFTVGSTREIYEKLSPDPAAPRFIGRVLAESTPIALSIDANTVLSADEWMAALVGTEGQRTFTLADGTDGSLPSAADYQAAFDRLGGVAEVSIVAAPGYSSRADSQDIQSLAIAHAEARRYCIAVLDSPEAKSSAEMSDIRGTIDSTRAAIYYPWIVVASETGEITVPPSGAVCGIYARTDNARDVSKAPANEVVNGALRFERNITKAEQDLLNPIGVNCLRFFPGRGYRVWGARTTSSDPEWKYVNIRRYFNYLEASIDRGTQWAVFEPNGEALWATVRTMVSDFLMNEWKSGALLGVKPEEAFFVRCDATTMTQDDIECGRLICEIGIAALRPAEFVIFRVRQNVAGR